MAALAEQSAPQPGPLRAAVAGVEPAVVLAVAVAVLVGRAAAATRGGPVVLPPEDARLLLTWPVPRRTLVLPALVAALARALGVAVLAAAALVYVDIRDLGAPAAAVLRDDVALPVLLSAATVLAAWLVQVTPAAARVARLAGSALGLAGVVAVCWFGRRIADEGYLGALQNLAARLQTGLPFSGAATGRPSSSGLVLAVALLGVLVVLAVLSWRATSRVTAEQLMDRSRRADVTRTSLRLGFTSSVYLSRTEPVRRSRRRRLSLPPSPRHLPALVGKAFVQEQGTPVLPRLLACATVTGITFAAAARVTPGRDLAPTVVWSLLLGGALAALATRFADPVRLDVDRAPVAGAVPVRHLQLARVDVAVSAGVAFVGAAVGTLGAAALGLVPAGKLPVLGFACAAVAFLLPAAGALGALSDDPSPLLPPAAAIGYRTSGVIVVLVACVGAGTVLRHASPQATSASPDRLPSGVVVLAVVAAVGVVAATLRAAHAVTRGR
jgi:hypothetical protein